MFLTSIIEGIEEIVGKLVENDLLKLYYLDNWVYEFHIMLRAKMKNKSM